MGSQLALFPGTMPPEVPVACVAPALREEPLPAQASAQQMGLFDAQVRRLRAALDAVAMADLPAASALLADVTPEFDPVVTSMRQRVVEISHALQRVEALSPPAQVTANLELGRRLAVEIEPWSSLGRALVARVARGLGPAEGTLAGLLFVEAGDLQRARNALQAVPDLAHAAGALFALGDVESRLASKPAARRYYRDALLLDPFDGAFDCVFDEEVRGLPDIAELEVEIEGDPRAWSAPVGIVAAVLPRPHGPVRELPLPADCHGEPLVALVKAREFVDALVRAGAPDVQNNRDAVLDERRCMKRASRALFAWYLARQVGAS